MSKVEKYTQEAIDIANDNSHGYSQANRNGNPDYDCSSLVCNVVQRAGIPVMDKGASYTGNMYSAFKQCGFRDVTSSCNLSTGSGMIRGDILLNHANHTAIYIGHGQLVHARSSEGNTQPGDQSGNEIRTQSYWNYPWDCVLRYPETVSTTGTETDADASDPIPVQVDPVSKNTLEYGSVGAAVCVLQALLNYYGSTDGDGKELDIDGEFGLKTFRALYTYQGERELIADGICGEKTWGELLK